MVEDKVGGLYPAGAEERPNLGCSRSLHKGSYSGKSMAGGGYKNWVVPSGYWSLEEIICDSRCWLCWECAVKLGKVW